MSREAQKTKLDVDLTKPLSLNLEDIKIKVSCFGNEWDPATKECSQCSANEICAIFTKQKVDEKVAKIEEEEGHFLDSTDFNFDTEALLDWIKNKSGDLTVQELVIRVKSLAKTRDEVAVVEWLKRFIKNTENLSTKSGIVHYGN